MSNEVKIRLTEEDLKKMTPEERKALFRGKDPIEDKGFRFSGPSIGLAFTIAIGLILIAIVIIQYVIKPEIVAPMVKGQFELPLNSDNPVFETDLYLITAGYWNQENFSQFIPVGERLLLTDTFQGDDNVEARKELYLYLLRAHIFNEDFERAREFARFIQSRHPYDNIFMSDVFYYRGHIILQTMNYRNAYGAFRESFALGGRYASEAERAMNNIDRMSKPLW
ncbi:MAG: hypothetical protein LAT67_05580 [Balneolales bacterium]|nr:hypothetical protein [Balneolales bacterium]